MEYTTENIEQAVSLFYRSDSGQQATAHQWLADAQNSPQAWTFVWDLLDPRRPTEVQFFAATTLHIKLNRHWNDIPVEHYQELKKKIVDYIIGYATGPKLILNRLCITLSAYVIHTIASHWPTAFGDLINNFQPLNLPNIEPDLVTWILLEILTVIPEEFSTSLLSGRIRLEVKSLLGNSSHDIVNYIMHSCLANPQRLAPGNADAVNITTQLSVVKCLSAWIQMGHLTIQDCSELMSMITDIVCYVYWSTFTDEDVLDASEEQELIEVAVEILQCVLNQGSTQKYPTYIMKHMLEHTTKFGRIIEAEKAKPMPNKEVTTFMYGVIITTSDAHCRKLLEDFQVTENSGKHLIVQILDLILGCSNSRGEYPVDETDSFIPFTFWYTFQEEIISIQSTAKKLMSLAKHYYQQLVLTFLKKSAYSFQYENQARWSLDDKELFRCYRQDIADTYLYCYNVLGMEMLNLMLVQLQISLSEYKTNGAAHWNKVESCLHCFMALSESIVDDNPFIPQFFDILRTIPYQEMNTKVLVMALDNVASYSEWLGDHTELIDKVMPLLLLGMTYTETEIATSATFAVKDVASNCIDVIEKYSESLIEICIKNLANNEFKLLERLRMMQILGHIISVLQADQSMYYLQLILEPLLRDIQNSVSSPVSSAVIIDMLTKLKLIMALFTTLNQRKKTCEEPAKLVVQSLLTLLAQVIDKYFDNEDIMKVICDLLKHCITGLMNASKPLIPEIFQLLLNAYLRVPNAYILTLSQMIIILFGRDEDMQEILNKYLIALVGNTLQLFVHLSNCNRLSEQSDVVEGLYLLLVNMFRKTSCQINTTESLDYQALFQCATLCLALPEPTMVKACVGFLSEFILRSREQSQTSVIQNNGEALVNKVLTNLGGAAARSCTEPMVDILYSLNKKYCDDLSRWLAVQLSQKDFPSPFVNDNQKKQFMVAVLREKANKKKLQEIATEFTLICRHIIKEEATRNS